MLRLKNVNKKYGSSEVLRNINLSFRSNEFVMILGKSGSGKSTLLNLIAGLDNNYDGNLIIDGINTKSFKERDWDYYRNNKIGIIFQNYNLINNLDVYDNLELPMIINGINKDKRKNRINYLLNKISLSKYKNKYINILSGGEAQRIAILRALVNDPKILLCDEPTGALDTKTSKIVMNLLKEVSKDKLIIMVTHNEELANKYATRIIKIEDGIILNDTNPYIYNTNNEYEKRRNKKIKLTKKIKIALNNYKSNYLKNILTSFAISISILSIALVLTISSGIKNNINKLEKHNLSLMPIIIEKETIINSNKINNIDKQSKNKIYPDYSYNTVYYNKLNNDLIEYVNKLNNDIKLSYNSNYYLDSNNNKLSFNLLNEVMNKKILENEFDLLYGSYSNQDNSLILIVDNDNKVNNEIYEFFSKSKNINYSEILNTKIMLNNKNMFISGIYKYKKDSNVALMYDSGLYYNNKLINKLDKNKLELSKISIYPKNYKDKNNIIKYLNKYKEKIYYSDYAKVFVDTILDITNIISIVLVVFSIISIIVSIIMIITITYINIIENEKKIGILRSFGTRKKDVVKIFRIENIFIGLTGGIIGIIINGVLIKPINIILENYTGIKNICSFNYNHISLVLLAILITIIGGYIPSKLACKKEIIKCIKAE